MKVTRFQIPRDQWTTGHIIKAFYDWHPPGYKQVEKYECDATGHFLLAAGYSHQELFDAMYSQEANKAYTIVNLIRVLTEHGLDYADIYEINDGGPLTPGKEAALIAYFAEHDVELEFV